MELLIQFANTVCILT